MYTSVYLFVNVYVHMYLRGVNTNKCECVNKMTMIRARRTFIF
jgi:hypothetical protein